MSKQDIETAATDLGLTLQADFVPWSQSRNKEQKNPSLNWHITLKRNGRDVLSTDYSAGSGHAPSYKQGDHTVNRHNAIMWECEHGKRVANIDAPTGLYGTDKPLEPSLADVLYSLSMDADVLDSATFEEWASNLGYETDSRKAEATYHECLRIALKLRNALGEDGLTKLRQACADY